MQFSFRHEDSRMRVMIAYEPTEFVTVPSTSIKIPSALAIGDITISRERLINADDSTLTLPSPRSFSELNPHYIWRKTIIEKDFGGAFSGIKDIFYFKELKDADPTSTERQIEVPSDILSFYGDIEEDLDFENNLYENMSEFEKMNLKKGIIEGRSNEGPNEGSPKIKVDKDDGGEDEDDDEFIDMDFTKIYDGGLLIQAPIIILAGEEVDIKMSWSVPMENSETARTLYIADASFSAMNDVLNKTRRKKGGNNLVEQPIMSKFSVQTLKKQ
eukprot:CAMPEP_0119044318 /NCGR_PEP_ID=MMETSP1177-20130426/30582_1 /TAXON_ID=2985 /ORGANISM="Ochromonas sp, Strain CCMP1899" /LENGTH=271 /DNA_ID=CAMNT_0007014261 /DNA_START=511 /DNA_END=1326 /DNA_ORIENTATION=+